MAVLAACGTDSGSEPTDAGSSKRIEITVEGGTISPNGERVRVERGQPIEFVVTADSAGEIHVHSDPEKTLAYQQGTTILELGSFDIAGIIEVESHDLGNTIVQLQIQ
jgi:hypothetical protein